MTTRALATLIAIVEGGSFAAAARRQNMTLSAVSMQVKSLETELDVALFDRSFRPPKLTPIGRAVAEQARAIVAAQEDLVRLCSGGQGLSGRFRIGFVLTSSVRLLPGFLSRARQSYPNATFEVATGLSDLLLQRAVRGDLDAAIITGGEDLPAGVRETVLHREEMVYCLPAFARAWSVERCMSELAFIHFMPQAGIGRLIARHLASEGLSPRETIVLDSVEAVAECVAAGVGFGVLPRPDVERYTHGRMVLRSLGAEPVMRSLVLVTRAGSPSDAASETLAGLLRGDGDPRGGADDQSS